MGWHWDFLETAISRVDELAFAMGFKDEARIAADFVSRGVIALRKDIIHLICRLPPGTSCPVLAGP